MLTSALAEHMSHNYTIAWSKAEVLRLNVYLHQHCTTEAWHICSQP